MMSRPIRIGLILCRTAKPMPMGAMMPTAPGTTAPEAVRAPVIRNITHGMRAILPRTARVEAWTSQSTVPLFLAIANKSVTPTSTTNRSPGKPANSSSADSPATAVPTINAATMAMTPMCTLVKVAMTNTSTRPMMEMT